MARRSQLCKCSVAVLSSGSVSKCDAHLHHKQWSSLMAGQSKGRMEGVRLC